MASAHQLSIIGDAMLSINGKRIDAIKGGVFPAINPATEEVIGHVNEYTSIIILIFA
jgi:hypothetical protein